MMLGNQGFLPAGCLMLHSFVRALAGLGLLLLVTAGPAQAQSSLFTFGDMLDLQALPAQGELDASQQRLFNNLEFYAYTVFETLQIANRAAQQVNQQPLFCAPASAFEFTDDGAIIRLADRVAEEVLQVTKENGLSLASYKGQPASAVMLLGLQAVFPCG